MQIDYTKILPFGLTKDKSLTDGSSLKIENKHFDIFMFYNVKIDYTINKIVYFVELKMPASTVNGYF